MNAATDRAAAARADAKAGPKSETVEEHVLYRGAFADEVKQPLFSDSDLDLVRLHRLDEVRNAMSDGRAKPVLSISTRTVVYPLDAAGKRLAIGSTCEEKEVT